MHTTRKGGFSLIEVNLAILIAALGLLMLFQLFPVGLRQSVQSESDLKQTTFANALFEEINANIRGNTEAFDNVLNWNDPGEFWRYATTGMDLPADMMTLVPFKQLAHVKSENLKADLYYNDETDPRIPAPRFALREEKKDLNTARLRIPPQMLIRLRTVINNDGRGPNSYVVSVVSTDAPYPAFLHNRQVYSREYYYQRRP